MAYLQELFRKYVDGSLTETERQELYHLLQKGMADEAMREMIDRQFCEWSGGAAEDPLLGEQLFAQLESRIGEEDRRRPAERRRSVVVTGMSFVKRFAVAACLLIAAGMAFVTWRHAAFFRSGGVVANKNDVMPGGNRASLTLANGTVIDLDSSGSGLLTRQGSVAVSKQGNGQLVYRVGAGTEGGGAAGATAGGTGRTGAPVEKGLPAVEQMNVLATPRGGQYEVILPDGTRALLNAASSLRYPTAFTGKERKVTLTGEAYFEVIKEPGKPFVVETANMRVQVLGTSFDIMAYDNEATVRTTLLTGKVKEISGGPGRLAGQGAQTGQDGFAGEDSVTLAPGQQAVLRRDGERLTREVIDTDEVIAWKDGLFLYSNRVDIPTIMRQLERWYDIDVHYEGGAPAQTFYGGIQRSLPLSKVLSILERTGVKFKVEGKDITVLN